MPAPRRDRLVLGFALAAWLWPVSLVAALVFLPRWYTLDDWRESVIRVAFFAGLAVTPMSAAVAIVLAKRAGGADLSAPLRAALLLAWIVLGLLALAALALFAFFAAMET